METSSAQSVKKRFALEHTEIATSTHSQSILIFLQDAHLTSSPHVRKTLKVFTDVTCTREQSVYTCRWKLKARSRVGELNVTTYRARTLYLHHGTDITFFFFLINVCSPAAHLQNTEVSENQQEKSVSEWFDSTIYCRTLTHSQLIQGWSQGDCTRGEERKVQQNDEKQKWFPLEIEDRL